MVVEGVVEEKEGEEVVGTYMQMVEGEVVRAARRRVADNPEDAGEDNEGEGELIPELVEGLQEDIEVENPDLQDFSNNLQSNEVPIPDVEPGEDFVELPPFETPGGFNDRKGHYHRNYVGQRNPKTPLDYYKLFIDDEIIETFVTNTNVYGRRYVKGWLPGNDSTKTNDTNPTEMKAFIAVILYSGIVQYPSRREMFDKSSKGSAFAKSLFTFVRFNMLVSAWHYIDVTDYHEMDEAEQAEFRSARRFFHVDELAALLTERFRSAFRAGQQMDLDEQGVPWKGRHRCRCYNPAKPFKWHFKIFSLNDSSTGYCVNFYLYQGKSEDRPAGMSATTYPFWKLFISLPELFRNKNHLVVTDNWFTSLFAIRMILESGNHFLGTFRVNRSGFPAIAKFAKSGPNKRDRGDLAQFETTDNHRVYAVSWMDNQPVHMLSSLPTKCMQVKRSVQIPNTNIWNTIQIPCATIIPLYNEGMGGIEYQISSDFHGART